MRNDISTRPATARNSKARIAELEKSLKAFAGIDPDTARRAIAQAEALEDQRLIDAGEVDKVIKTKVDKVRADHSSEIEAMSAALQQTETELAETKISDQIKSAAINAGVLDTAVVDVLNRAKRVWHLDDDRNPVARDGDGELMLDGGKRMTIPAWIEGMRAESGFLFKGHNKGNDTATATRDAHGRQVIDTSQPNAIGMNLEAFAKGEAVPAGGLDQIRSPNEIGQNLEAFANGRLPHDA